MRSTQQLSITLPNEMANLVRAKVATGEYATESEVIRDGLRTLLARDRAVDKVADMELNRNVFPLRFGQEMVHIRRTAVATNPAADDSAPR